LATLYTLKESEQLLSVYFTIHRGIIQEYSELNCAEDGKIFNENMKELALGL